MKNRSLEPQPTAAGRPRLASNSINAIDRFQARFPHIPILNVRYEDLCRDMPATLLRVCRFLEVPYEPALENSSASARPCHVLGNRMRLNFSGQVEECLRWQQELTPAEIRFLNRTLRGGLERYHYAHESGIMSRESGVRGQESGVRSHESEVSSGGS